VYVRGRESVCARSSWWRVYEVCVCERERERERARVCVYASERECVREGERVCVEVVVGDEF